MVYLARLGLNFAGDIKPDSNKYNKYDVKFEVYDNFLSSGSVYYYFDTLITLIDARLSKFSNFYHNNWGQVSFTV